MLLHSRTKRNLQRYLEQPSAGLAIMGERGSGKEYVAHHIAGQLLKTQNTYEHPSIHIIDAAIVKSAIESVRELQKTLSIAVPGNANIRRIVLILRFDAFGHEAQNAMLKTLEEPPEGTIFVLTIDQPAAVLPTIYSRVQQLHILSVSLPVALEAYPSSSEQAIKKAYQISGGAVGLLAGLIENAVDHPMIAAIEEAKRVLRMPKYARIAAVDAMVKNKDLTAAELLDGILRIVKAAQNSGFVHEDQKAQRLGNTRTRLVLDAIKDLQDGVSQKLVLTRLFLDL